MRLADIFTSSMVFAANRPIRIFGYGAGTATITFAGHTKVIESKEDFFCTELPAMEYGGPYTLTFTEGEHTVTLEDIYVGEVFLFSGQSNMDMYLSQTNTDPSAYEDIDTLRYAAVPPSPQDFSWSRATRERVGNWSALGYLVGREIGKEKGIPVGIICCAKGASAIESWMPEGALERIGIQIPLEEKFIDHYHEQYGEWNHDGDLYKSKLSRVIPFAISGVVWYQGESDASEAEGRVYERELQEMIRIWREKFMDGALPFVIVQIADCKSRIALGPGWRLVQEAQEKVSQSTPAAYTVISRDVCETDDIHPQTKDKLAARIAEVIKKNF